ncbi:hypothetical protein [Aliarcobacter butzleri]|uniref:hypothetical protein n=1 Tax=Aliarcobacter butzleri TaxID=28197 RepID=UPI003B222A7D
MLKITLILIFSFSLSNADTMYNGKCVKDFYTLDKSKIYLSYSNGSDESVSYSVDKINSLISNDVFTYHENSNKCYIKNYYGLTKNQFNFMSALTGLLTSFLIVSAIQKRV